MLVLGPFVQAKPAFFLAFSSLSTPLGQLTCKVLIHCKAVEHYVSVHSAHTPQPCMIIDSH